MVASTPVAEVLGGENGLIGKAAAELITFTNCVCGINHCLSDAENTSREAFLILVIANGRGALGDRYGRAIVVGV